MNSYLKEEVKKHGDRLQIVTVQHLKDLRQGIEELKSTEELNGFQQWIVNDLYQFELPDTGFEVKSILILALYHPFYAEIEFTYQGKKYYTKSLVRSYFQEGRNYLSELLSKEGYHLHEIDHLPLKRLAVQSGLAVYGRNNITYVEDLGSNVSYLAFLSDVPCEKEEWREVCVADICSQCNACISLCPTGAIRKDRFLIDNQRCLSAINEGGGDFPDWLPADVHHTLYDCLRCQEKCRLNKTAVQDVIGPISFTEEEINMLLEGKGLDDFSEEFKGKAERIGLFDWSQGLPRNIMAIIHSSQI